MEQMKTNLMNQFQLSEIEADQIVYIIQVLTTDLSKVFLVLIPFILTGHLVEYFSILLMTLILRSQAGGFHFKRYITCLGFTITYFISILLLTRLTLPYYFMMTLGGLSVLTIYMLSPMLSEQRKRIKRLNVKSLKIRAVAIAVMYLVFFIIKINPFTLCAIWVLNVQAILLLIQKGVLYVSH